MVVPLSFLKWNTNCFCIICILISNVPGFLICPIQVFSNTCLAWPYSVLKLREVCCVQ